MKFGRLMISAVEAELRNYGQVIWMCQERKAPS